MVTRVKYDISTGCLMIKIKYELITPFKMTLYKVSLVHFDIYKFDFEEYLRKEKDRIFENSSTI